MFRLCILITKLLIITDLIINLVQNQLYINDINFGPKSPFKLSFYLHQLIGFLIVNIEGLLLIVLINLYTKFHNYIPFSLIVDVFIYHSHNSIFLVQSRLTNT